jgi:ribosomal protein L11 methylase PrmA
MKFAVSTHELYRFTKESNYSSESESDDDKDYLTEYSDSNPPEELSYDFIVEHNWYFRNPGVILVCF